MLLPHFLMKADPGSIYHDVGKPKQKMLLTFPIAIHFCTAKMILFPLQRTLLSAVRTLQTSMNIANGSRRSQTPCAWMAMDLGSLLDRSVFTSSTTVCISAPPMMPVETLIAKIHLNIDVNLGNHLSIQFIFSSIYFLCRTMERDWHRLSQRVHRQHLELVLVQLDDELIFQRQQRLRKPGHQSRRLGPGHWKPAWNHLIWRRLGYHNVEHCAVWLAVRHQRHLHDDSAYGCGVCAWWFVPHIFEWMNKSTF